MTVVSTPSDPVRAQVEALRGKLLDLTLRNRMLNYRPSKRIGITTLGEDSFLVHRILVEDGKKMSFMGRPDPVDRNRRPRDLAAPDDEVAMLVFQQAAQEELDAFLENGALPVNQLDTKLTVDDYESVLQAKLRMIAREAGTAREELGINTLFLTLATLEWSESPERSYRAPLLYIPVMLQRQTNGSMRLVHDGGDVGANLPLKAKLAEFNLRLPDRDEDKDLLDYFSEIESIIRDREGWELHRDEISLGFFNYEKYAMYVDLGGDTWPADKKPWSHRDLQAMLGGGYSSPDSPISENTYLDEVRPVGDAHEVYDADSSQVIAMMRAAEGLSIVVEGPPGTGKSQTITNMIADAILANKTVLFVSAKRAATEVVKRKLEEADLGATCLDLHDKMTNRREFYAELKRTVSRSLSLRGEEARLERLTNLRALLNAHSRAVNETLSEYGTSPFRAMSILAALPAEEPIDREWRISFETLRTWNEGEIRAVLPLVEALQSRLIDCGVPVQHPFWGAAIDYLDPARKLDLKEDLDAATSRLSVAAKAMAVALDALKIKIAPTVANLGTLRQCLEQAISAPPHDGVAVRTETWDECGACVGDVIGALKRTREVRGSRAAQVRPEIWKADLLSIEHAYDQFADKWYKSFAAPYRQAKRGLDVYLLTTAPRDASARRNLVRDIRCVQAATTLIDEAGETMRRLIGVQWKGLETDPAVVERLMTWVQELGGRVEGGELPRGLLDFFEGSYDSEALRESVERTEMDCKDAMSSYSSVADLLKLNRTAASDEPLPDLLLRTERWRDHLQRLPEFIRYNEAKRQVMERSLASTVEIADRWPLAGERLRNTFLRSYYSGVVREAMEARPELKSFEREGHERLIQEFQTLDDFKLKYNRAQVRLAHQRQLPTFENAIGNLHALKLQCELQRKHKPIRWIMARAGEAIQRIKPVFMMSPLSVAIHLPPELPSFDLVIFDEASQVKPEDALCSVIRGKQCIVVGDTRQMPPTSFFDRVVEDDDDFDEIESQGISFEARKLESVLSLMSAVTTGRVRRPDLRWHYRSVHPSLIQPSNEMFYDNRLIVFPSPGDQHLGSRAGVIFHHLPDTAYEGGARKRINRKEAETVADHVLQHVLAGADQSLLVAAMNKPQADLIYAELQKRERIRPEAFRRYCERHPHEPLDVKNLENVQGDERDVIFISVTYGRDSEGHLRQQFGPLLVDGGERRLNVLITRARQRCEVFSNITAEDIRLEGPRPGVQALKRYLRFARDGTIETPEATGLPEESPFEEEVTAALRDQGFAVDCQVGTEGYRIDIGVVDPDRPGSYVLGIECDGATYHSARSARDRDKLRQRILEARGWKLHRIWSTDWWQDRDGEIQRLLRAIEGATLPHEDAAVVEPTTTPEVSLDVVTRRAPTPATRPYTTAPVPSASVTTEDLVAHMMDVVKCEGPITEDLLLVRLRDAWGVQRAGSNLRPWFQSIISTHKSQVMSNGVELYWSRDQVNVPRDWSSRPASERKAERVPEVELAAAVRAVVASSFGVNSAEVSRAAFQLIGFRRVSDVAAKRVATVVKRMVEASGLVIGTDGLLRLPDHVN